ncbi:MAG: ATP-binding cassette domain-containing protein [Alphaproteobacteria bacterium]|nr:ATP-binding cassette domain-containing protein [Alphaproteobacteria bacterium]
MTAHIEIQGLTKEFGPYRAVNGLTFSVAKGEVLGFLGPNGAGKSTTMRMITGYLTPTSGSVRVLGHDIVEERLAAQQHIGYLPEGAPAYGDMTAGEFLRFGAAARGLSREAAEKAVAGAAAKTQLASVLDRPIETLSKGFKRRVGLAQAILHDPPVLIMDEPTDGLDPNQKFAVRRLIESMGRDKAIIISTHILEEVEAVCTRALIIDRGRIVADGRPAELMARSSFHNAVTIEVPGDRAGEAKASVLSLHGVAEVRERRLKSGAVRLTAMPARGTDQLVEAVGAVVRARGIATSALFAEEGRLDEVFRTLTTSDALATSPGAADASEGAP